MPADRRLTIETLKPGMKVRCVDAPHSSWEAGQLREGEIYTVKGPRGDTGDIWLEGVFSSWEPSHFIPADPEPAPSWATEELLGALLIWHRVHGSNGPSSPSLRVLWNAIRSAPGLLPPSPPGTTERAATINPEWFI